IQRRARRIGCQRKPRRDLDRSRALLPHSRSDTAPADLLQETRASFGSDLAAPGWSAQRIEIRLAGSRSGVLPAATAVFLTLSIPLGNRCTCRLPKPRPISQVRSEPRIAPHPGFHCFWLEAAKQKHRKGRRLKPHLAMTVLNAQSA